MVVTGATVYEIWRYGIHVFSLIFYLRACVVTKGKGEYLILFIRILVMHFDTNFIKGKISKDIFNLILLKCYWVF